MQISVGDKIKFKSEKQRYTVQACDDRFVIATKPFNARKTFLYTIIDLKEKIRGADDWHCKHEYNIPEEARLGLIGLNNNGLYDIQSIQISHRNRVKLDIERVDKK